MHRNVEQVRTGPHHRWSWTVLHYANCPPSGAVIGKLGPVAKSGPLPVVFLKSYIGTQPHPFIYVLSIVAFTL